MILEVTFWHFAANTGARTSPVTTWFILWFQLETPKRFDYMNRLLELCTARIVFSILVTVRLYTVITEVSRWLTNEKQRKTDIR